MHVSPGKESHSLLEYDVLISSHFLDELLHLDQVNLSSPGEVATQIRQHLFVHPHHQVNGTLEKKQMCRHMQDKGELEKVHEGHARIKVNRLRMRQHLHAASVQATTAVCKSGCSHNRCQSLDMTFLKFTCPPLGSPVLACVAESHCQQRSTEIQSHPGSAPCQRGRAGGVL